MNVSLKPEFERYIDDQVKCGAFTSPAEVVEAGLARLMIDSEEDLLDAADIARLQRSIDQMRRGNVVDWNRGRFYGRHS